MEMDADRIARMQEQAARVQQHPLDEVAPKPVLVIIANSPEPWEFEGVEAFVDASGALLLMEGESLVGGFSANSWSHFGYSQPKQD